MKEKWKDEQTSCSEGKRWSEINKTKNYIETWRQGGHRLRMENTFQPPSVPLAFEAVEVLHTMMQQTKKRQQTKNFKLRLNQLSLSSVGMWLTFKAVPESSSVSRLFQTPLLLLPALLRTWVCALVVETFSKTDPERVRASTSSPRLTCDYFKTL